MAYFKDLTRYSYGDEAEAGADLNVGWLQAGRAFPKAKPDPAFVDALVRCCLHPVRLYRGFHDCDLCASAEAAPAARSFWKRLTRQPIEAPAALSLGQPSIEHKGRRIRLGNGEVRVESPDRIWFTAPTLVAHYVAVHEYSPPAAFVASVLEAATRIWCLDERQFGRLRSLSAAERFDLCLGLVADLNSRSENPWISAALERIRSAREVYLSPSEDGYTMQLLMHRLVNVIPRDEATEPEKWLRDAVFDLVGILDSAGGEGDEDYDLEAAAHLIERLVGSGKVESPW